MFWVLILFMKFSQVTHNQILILLASAFIHGMIGKDIGKDSITRKMGQRINGGRI